MQTCPHCGHSQEPDSRCGACGEWLGEIDTAPASDDAPEIATHEPQSVFDVDPVAPPHPEYAEWDDPADGDYPAEPGFHEDPEPHPFAAEPAHEPDHAVFEHAADDPHPAAGHDAEPHDAVDFDALSTAGATGRAAAMAPRRRAGLPAAVYFLITAALIMVIAMVVISQVRGTRRGDPDAVARGGAGGAGASADKSQEMPEHLANLRGDLRARWAELSELPRNEATTPLLDRAAESWTALDEHARAGQWSSVDVDLTTLSSTFASLQKEKEKLEELARLRKSADELRADVMRARSAAERSGAPELAGELWKQANAAHEQAAEKFDAAKFAEARADWDKALTAFEQANSLAAAGVAARQTRQRVERRMTQRFTTEQFEKLGGSPYADLKETLIDADEAYLETDYSEAMAGYEHAGELVENAERAVQRELGVKFYAVSAGYLAASILLEHASGQRLTDDGRRALRDAFADLDVSGSYLDALPAPSGDLAYSALAQALAIDGRQAVLDRRGAAAQKAYNIGFQLRIVQHLLGEEGAEKIPSGHLSEVGRSIAIAQREAEEAGFSEEVAAAFNAVRKTLGGPADASTLAQARAQWLSLIGKLSRYDSAIELVGPSTP